MKKIESHQPQNKYHAKIAIKGSFCQKGHTNITYHDDNISDGDEDDSKDKN